jgi:AcrR family transcriptional regulator
MSSEDRPFEPGIVPAVRPGKADGVRARNRRDRTAALCGAALELFRTRGLEPVTVDEITRAAGVSKGTFYRYFSDKSELVASIFAPLEAHLDEAIARCRVALQAAGDAGAMQQAYGQLAIELGGLLLGSSEVVELYLRESRGAPEPSRTTIHRLHAKIAAMAIDLTEIAQGRGLLRSLPSEVTALAVVGAVESLLLRHFAGAGGSPADVSAALISMVLDGSRQP